MLNMDDAMNIADPVDEALRNVSFDEKWEILKAEIEELYRRGSLKDVQAAMQARHGFSAKLQYPHLGEHY